MAEPLSDSYLLIRRVMRAVIDAFFRDQEVVGLENIPDDRGGLLVSWHPNGLIDPGLMITQFPHHVVFGARHGLFRYPLLGTLLRRMGTVPIYRAIDQARRDPAARRAANRRSLEALAAQVARGSYSALFPEGVSHDEPRLQELKTGAARLYYQARAQARARASRARQAPGEPPPVIIPVGLHYDHKQAFRSSALVAFHPPIVLPAELDVIPPEHEDPEQEEQRARALTDLIEQVLHDVVHATDDWALHHVMHRMRRLVRAERAVRAGADPGATTIGERVLGFAQVRAGYYAALRRDPLRVRRLRRRVVAYGADLRALGLEDYDLDRDPALSPWLAIISVFQFILVILLLPPLVLLGYIVNLPTALLLMLIAWVAARQQKDEATVKLLFGAMLYPLTWIVAGVAGGLGHVALNQAFPRLPNTPITVGVSVAVLGALGGILGLRYWKLVRDTARSVRVRLTRRRRYDTVARLKVEREEIHDEAVAMVADVDLPGHVLDDGRVVDGEGESEGGDDEGGWGKGDSVVTLGESGG
ncbi:MAG: 1-acyl-sn-glycerol-3-phosphate acyltransferase [Myxococcota bacterium]